MPRQINYNGRVQSFPDDATDDEIAEALEADRLVGTEAVVESGVERARGGAITRGRQAEQRAQMEAIDPRLAAATDIEPHAAAAAGAAPLALAGYMALPLGKAAALRALAGLAGTSVGGAIGSTFGAGLEKAGFPEGTAKTAGAVGGFGGSLVGGIGGFSGLRAVGGKLADIVGWKTALARRAIRDFAEPAAARAAAPTVAQAAAPAVVKAAAPAVSKTEASAQLEALLGNAMKEGRLAAAAKEHAKGNRQLAEKILGELQGEGVIAP